MLLNSASEKRFDDSSTSLGIKRADQMRCECPKYKVVVIKKDLLASREPAAYLFKDGQQERLQ